METVLITGGCGFIGSHTCICLLKKEFNVVIIDSLINSYKQSYINILDILKKEGKDFHKRLSFFEGDLRNKELLSQIFSEQKKAGRPISSVIHFAGLKSINASLNYPLEYWDNNVESTLSLLNVMEMNDCNNIIFSSSATVYKPKMSSLIKENDSVAPSSPYGKTKLTIEEILKDLFLSNKNKWNIANLRYFNPVGAHESGLLGEYPKDKASNLFPAIKRVITKKQEKLLIFGKDWPTKDGTCVRDFIHIMDLAEAHNATLDYLLDNKSNYLTVNIGTGIGTSVLEVINKFKELGMDLPHIFVDRRDGDHPFIVADNQLALKLLDWSPKRNLVSMCLDTLNKV